MAAVDHPINGAHELLERGGDVHRNPSGAISATWWMMAMIASAMAEQTMHCARKENAAA